MKQRGDRNYHKLMEDKLREIGGIKTLIAHNYYSEEEFWATFNKKNYQAVKAITGSRQHSSANDSLVRKMCKAAMGIDSRTGGERAGAGAA